MNSLGIFSLLAAALQLAIPSYGLRMIRRFGAQRVGWFLVLAFVSLASLHLLEPLRPSVFGGRSGPGLEVIYVIGSVLLLVGMAHLDTMISERLHASNEEAKLKRHCAVETQATTESLAQANKEMAEQIARLEKSQKQLAQSEAHYRFLFTENPQPMWIIDLRTLRFLSVNKAALAWHEYTEGEFMGLSAQGIVSPEAADAFAKNIAKPCAGVDFRGCWPLRQKGGTAQAAELTAIDLKYYDFPARLIVVEDVSARKRQEAESAEALRIETIAKVAGGVAHHFNNILTVITGQTSLLLEDGADAKANEKLAQIAAASQRGAVLSRQLLAAGGRQIMELTPTNLNDLAQKMSPILRRSLGSSFELKSSFGSNLPPVMADARLIETVIVSLVLNARDAMTAGGVVTLRTSKIRTTAKEIQGRPGAQAGEFVCLAVCDTGRGMQQEVQTHLFEPFFTTKDVGQAMGLGLASAYGIARQHSGWLECRSESGVGTEVRIFLPCASASAISAAPLPQATTAAATLRETILFIEPDDRMRAVGRFLLNRSGYSVIEADSASVAMMIWEAKHPRIDLLLTDVSLPENVSGVKLANKLRLAQPDLKVLFTRDANSEENGRRPTLPETGEMISKPYIAETLAQTIETHLAAR